MQTLAHRLHPTKAPPPRIQPPVPLNHHTASPPDLGRNSRAPRARVTLVANLVVAALLAALLAMGTAVTSATVASADPLNRTIQGVGQNTFQKEWFNTKFRAGGNNWIVEGRMRLVTDTTARLSNTRDLAVTPLGEVDGGNKGVKIANTHTSTQLKITSRPAFQLIYDFIPQGYGNAVCDVDNFPDMGGDWRKTIAPPAGSNHRCGAIEVTADDLNRIFTLFNIDLELPEVFDVFDQFIDPGYSGSRTYSETHQLFEIKACKMITDTFGIPIGDHCSLQVNAVASPTLKQAPGNTAKVQYCSDIITPTGTHYPCAANVGTEKTLVWGSANPSFIDKLPCVTSQSGLGLRVKDLAADIDIESIAIDISVDFNVNLTSWGAGWDVATLTIPTGIDLIDSNGEDNTLPIHLTYPGVGPMTMDIGTLVPDKTAPLTGFVGPMVVEEGLSHTVTEAAFDNCDTSALKYSWQIGSARPFAGGPAPVVKIGDNSLTRSYPTETVTSGTVTVTDSRGNAASNPFSVSAINGAADVTLNAPAGIAVNTIGAFSAPVVDEGPDIETWNWTFGNGATATRTGTSTTDRNDSRSILYSALGRYPVTVNVHDGSVSTTKSADVGVFRPGSSLSSNTTFTTTAGSGVLGVGLPFSVNTSAAYAANATSGAVPTGSFSLYSEIPIGGNEYAPVGLASTSVQFMIDRATNPEVQGTGTNNNSPGWTYRAVYARASATSPITSVTVRLWAPGTATSQTAAYVFTGPVAV